MRNFGVYVCVVGVLTVIAFGIITADVNGAARTIQIERDGLQTVRIFAIFRRRL